MNESPSAIGGEFFSRSTVLGLVAIAAALSFLVLANPANSGWGLSSSDWLALCFFVIGLLMSLLEAHRLQPWARISEEASPLLRAWNPAICRWVGLHLVLLVIGSLYWLLPEYRRPLYGPFFEVTHWVTPLIACLSLPYFVLQDRWQADRGDMLLAIGQTLLYRRRVRSDEGVTQFVLGWLVKAFFLPLMFCYAHQNLVFFQGVFANPSTVDITFATWIQRIITALFLLDLCWACMGYSWALRMTDTHIRSTDRSPLSWTATLACYEPWGRLVGTSYLATSDAHRWATWLPPDHPLHHLWGCVIVLLIGIYTASTLAFGLRFSNLTHRGIVSWGPYRYFRHPAYLSKNLSWWMVGVPFANAESTEEAIRNCLMLLGLNAVYWMRARTEEAHLGADPAYRSYSQDVQQRQQTFMAKFRRMVTTHRKASH